MTSTVISIPKTSDRVVNGPRQEDERWDRVVNGPCQEDEKWDMVVNGPNQGEDLKERVA